MLTLTPKHAFVAIGVALSLWLGVEYLRLLSPAQAREVRAACNGLRPSPTNGAIALTDAAGNPVPAPDFTAQDYSGNPVKLSDFRGKVVIVNFWASWCNTCKAEKPSLNELQGKFSTDDLVVLAVASDHDWNKIRAALPQGSPLTVLLDPPPDEDSNIGVIAQSYGIKAVPESFVVDRDGYIRYYLINKRDWNSAIAQTCLRSLTEG